MAVSDVTRLSRKLYDLQDPIGVLDAYYEGRQPLNYLDPRIAARLQGRLRTLVINWPRLVVGALEERLDVEGFRLGGTDAANDVLWGIWQDNDLDEHSQLGHEAALVHGLAFVSVWGHEDDLSRPLIALESAREVIVEYAPGTSRVIAALKRWVDDEGQHATFTTPTAIEKYVAKADPTDPTRWAVEPEWATLKTEANPLGVVPYVPLINRPKLGRTVGESELMDVLPLADAVNKLATDMMVASEYHAMPRRWATGVELGPSGDDPEAEAVREQVRQKWTEAEAGRVWLSANPDVKFGQFGEASLSNFTEAIKMLGTQIAALSGLPPHYLGVSTDNPASADAIRSGEASLVKRAQRKQRGFGGTWERAMRLALRVSEGALKGKAAPLPQGAERMETIWRSPETPTVAQKADAAVKLVGADIIHRETALEDLGYSPTQIAQDRERRQQASSSQAVSDVEARLSIAQRLMDQQGMSQPAAFAAAGLLTAAGMLAGDQPPPAA